MIVVRVELWSALTGKVTTLGVMRMSNVTTSGNLDKSDYHGEVMRKPSFDTVTREGIVRGHRRNSLVVWVLVRKMLEAMGY